MEKVTDTELIKKLNEKTERNRVTESKTGSTVVTDLDLIERLDKIREQNIKEEPVTAIDIETKEPVVARGSVVSRPFQQKMDEFLETAGAIGSSVGASALAGLKGAVTFAGTSGDFREAVRDIEQTQEALTYRPRSQGAQENLQALGEALSPVSEAIDTTSKYLQDKTLEFTGSPNLAGVAAAIPVTALELIGIKGATLVPGGMRRLTDADIRKAQKEMLLDPELRYEPSVATVKLDSKGKLVDDKAGKALVDKGIMEGDASVITNSSKATRNQMTQIARVFEQGKGNPVASMSNRTTKPIGTAITNRLSALQSKRRVLGKRLESVVEGDLGKTQVNIGDSLSGVGALLREAGVMPRVKKSTDGKITLELEPNWAEGTKFDLAGFGTVKKNIEDLFDVFNQQTDMGVTTVKQAHEAKKILDELIDSSKLTDAGISPQMQRTIAEMRQKINESLGVVDEYKAVNQELGEVISTMEPFSVYLKPGQRFVDAKVTDVVGAAMQNLSSKGVTGARLSQELADLESGLRKLGMSFGDDPLALVRFREILLENFNVDPRIPEYQMGQKAGAMITSAAIGNKFGAAHDAAALLSMGMKKSEAKRLAEQNQKAFNVIKLALQQGN
jgi:polyhydroxyalkanoate synthesis regulator phasin